MSERNGDSWPGARAVNEAVGAAIRAERRRQGITLEGLCDLSGGRLRPAIVGAYERGERQVNVARLAELADVLNVSVSRLWPASAPNQSRLADDVERAAVKLQEAVAAAEAAGLRLDRMEVA